VEGSGRGFIIMAIAIGELWWCRLCATDTANKLVSEINLDIKSDPNNTISAMVMPICTTQQLYRKHTWKRKPNANIQSAHESALPLGK
jgi:hypothetical protein